MLNSFSIIKCIDGKDHWWVVALNTQEIKHIVLFHKQKAYMYC